MGKLADNPLGGLMTGAGGVDLGLIGDLLGMKKPSMTTPPIAGDQNMSQAVMGFPAVGLSGIQPGQIGRFMLGGGLAGPGGFAGPETSPDTETPIEVVAKDTWQPRKPTILGAIADAYLMANGLKPAYQINRDQRSMGEAMQGFMDNPKRAISRISKIRGMEDDAWGLWDKYTDNQRLQSVQDRQLKAFDSKYEEGVLGVVSNMMAAATPETWMPMRQRAIEYAKNKGVPLPFDIPEQYDSAADAGISNMKVDPYKQGRLQQGDRRLDQGDTRLEQGDRRLNITEDHYNAQEAQQAINERGRNARAAQSEAGKNARSKKPGAAKGAKGRVIPTPYGEMELSASGNTGKIGKTIWRKVAPGKWEQVN